MKKTAIFPGTFDPLTLGHIDLINRATQLFDTVTIAIATGVGKIPAFTLEERLSLTQAIFQNYPQVRTTSFSGLLVDFMQENAIQVVIRGIRNLADAEYELQLATINQAMKPDIETVFLPTHPKYAHISSTAVREIAAKGGSLAHLSLFVPPLVVEAFKKTYVPKNY
jgi:pantetheine-phosphate adenylyltransferase